MTILTIKDLAIKHDYYCSDSNYYSNKPYCKWESFKDFYEEMKDADMNLVFRWDVIKEEDSDVYYMEIFMIHQRKGIFAPHFIQQVTDEDVILIIEYLKPHKKKLDKIWLPF